ncbi:MAG: efflux RND transporter permease subunit [Candidatus Eisenbacteria bacterium]|uniref:Efflux RND transporter permease subunit n=1 Tax=Eiseniibacteriota bacterium TaxID=2212470 RepID=A0A937XEZ7_UNCEI|nr:efflux RND transporter permease subunit [Candidatus Eisenbacteria bacterium]
MLIDGEDRRVQLAFADADKIQYEQVMDRTLTTRQGRRVRLGELITLQTRPVLGSIQRQDQRYTLQINWEYIGTDAMRQRYIQEVLAGIRLPYGYTAEDVSGQSLTREEEEQMRTVLWVTLLFIFMTLAVLFESFTLPLLTLLGIPMALTGVAAIFWAARMPFDSSARIGLVLLFGVVVNNAILLINRFRLQVRELVAERGYGPEQVPAKARLGGSDLWRLPAAERLGLLRRAVGDGVGIQLRSILLTSGTTIAGLLPLLVRLTDEGAGSGRDIWENLALTSIGGLISSTLLILGALPALYFVFARLGWALARLAARLRGRSPERATAAPAPETA